MLAWLLRQTCGWAVLLTFTSSLGFGWSTSSHLGPADDADCGPAALAPAHPGSQFEAVKPASATGHCAFCHWQRSIDGAHVIARMAGFFQFRLLARSELTSVWAPTSAALDLLTSRGPPNS